MKLNSMISNKKEIIKCKIEYKIILNFQKKEGIGLNPNKNAVTMS
jgi:hypothetical protein